MIAKELNVSQSYVDKAVKKYHLTHTKITNQLSEDKVNSIVENLLQGMKDKQTAKILNISNNSVWHYKKIYNLKEKLEQEAEEKFKIAVQKMGQRGLNPPLMAKSLHIDTTTFYRKIKKYNLSQLLDDYQKQAAQQFLERKNSGKTPKDIAEEFGVSERLVNYRINLATGKKENFQPKHSD